MANIITMIFEDETVVKKNLKCIAYVIRFLNWKFYFDTEDSYVYNTYSYIIQICYKRIRNKKLFKQTTSYLKE